MINKYRTEYEGEIDARKMHLEAKASSSNDLLLNSDQRVIREMLVKAEDNLVAHRSVHHDQQTLSSWTKWR